MFLTIIQSKAMDINQYCLLCLVERGFDIRTIPDERVKSWLQGLVRKGFVTNESTLTIKGEEFWKNISTVQFIPESSEPILYEGSKQQLRDQFEYWWKNAYCKSNHFSFKGKSFMGTQKKDIKKEECFKHYATLVNSKKYTAMEILQGTLEHMRVAKELSFQTNDNKLTYIPNSERYLREEFFSVYIKKGEQKDQDTGSAGPAQTFTI